MTIFQNLTMVFGKHKQKLLAVASGQNESWDGGGGRFNDPGPKPKYPWWIDISPV
jgi:hypothetical protein